MSEEAKETAAAAAPANDGSQQEQKSIHELKKVMHNTTVESNGEHKSLWTMTKETMGMADGGKSKATDTLVDTEPEALVAIKKMIAEAKQKDASSKKPHPGMWDFQWTPVKELNATLDDVFLAFCRWTRKDNETDNDEDKTMPMNIDKAFRRLESYALWMFDAKSDLEEPLTVSSFKGAAKAFGMKLTHDATGHIVWWFDLPKTDLEAIKNNTISVSESLRYFIWSTHVVLLDKEAQDNGLLFIEDLQGISFWSLMTSFPGDLGAKLDRLTIGVLPIQMKGLYILHADGWWKLLMSLMKAFMSKKMRQRIITLGKKEDASSIVTQAVGGPQYIPVDCCGMEGTAETDIIFGTYITE
jgi:hypothetical protein